MIENFIETATFIDDNPDETKDLQSIFKRKKIFFDYYHPKEFSKTRFKLKNRKLIFLDFELNPTINSSSGHISYIRRNFRKIIGKNFGIYGIIVWSKHIEYIEEFKEKISNDSGIYTMPLFIVGLNKTKYMREGYKDIIKDIQSELSKNIAASFFINWTNNIEKAKTSAINDIFSLVQDYNIQNENLKFLLYHLARNKTGIHYDNLDGYSLHNDAYYAFNELLSYNVNTLIKGSKCKLFDELNEIKYQITVDEEKICQNYKEEYFKNGDLVDSYKLIKEINSIKNKIKVIKEELGEDPENQYLQTRKKFWEGELQPLNNELKKYEELDKSLKKHFATINTKLLLDEDINSKTIIPGNIYLIERDNNILISDKKNESDIPIVIEMTPPCDFANGKKASEKVKVLGGFITKYSEGRKESLRGDAIYTEPHPLNLKAYSNEEKMLAFDFRYIGIIKEKDLMNRQKYKLIYRAKDNLFADILQKMSAHTARLGLSVLH
jgi:DNA-binding transcriptional regulator GbsR (MarR family)